MAAKGRLNPFGDSSKNFVYFPSLSHKKGVHRIVRGLESNCGLILLTGEIGIGKTSLARHIQSYLSDRYVFVELGNPYQTPLEQVFYCCEKFGLDTTGLSSIHDCVGKLEKYFHEVLEYGKRPVIVFDESHLLTKRHLSLIHILSNLRAEDGPLVQILMVGQLEILDLLATEGMEALNQRIGVRCELSPLVLEDTDKYINFKLDRSGRSGLMEFSPEAVKLIWKESSGLPRLINHVCAHALDALAFRDTNVVTPTMVDEVCRDSVYTGMFKAKTRKGSQKSSWKLWALCGVGVLSVGIIVAWFLLFDKTKVQSVVQIGTPVTEPKPFIFSSSAEHHSSTKESFASPRNIKEDLTSSQEVQSGEISDVVTPSATQMKIESKESQPGTYVIVDEYKWEAEDNPQVSPAAEVRLNPDEAKDGSVHPVISRLVIGAIAWNEVPSASVVVVNSNLLHEGETVDDVKVLNIGQDYILFDYKGESYRLVFHR